MPANLLLHCGAHAVPRSQLAATPTPTPTQTWQPIPHARLLTQVEETLPRFGLSVAGEAHALTHDNSRYFGLLEIQNGSNSPDHGWVLGLRNSHDKRFTAGLVAGSSVFVCDNLAFSGEIEVSRKHTTFVMRDLYQLIERAVRKLTERWHDQDKRIARYQEARLTDRQAHDIIIQALDVGVVPASKIPAVLHEWREPRHEAFRPRNCWSLFNGFSEVLKGRLHDLPKRTEALHRLCDRFVGIN